MILIAVGLPTVAAAWFGVRVAMTRRAPLPSAPRALAERPPVRALVPLTASDLDRSFQGDLRRADGRELWLAVRFEVIEVSHSTVRFRYRVRSSDHTESGIGTASLLGRWIRFGPFHGHIHRTSEGIVSLQSMASQQIEWTLDARDRLAEE
ncbi:MAG TPA: hypothetical protein VGF28_13255 [Thermoanaerobaculia bacterium]|jgi:hypothetical protein